MPHCAFVEFSIQYSIRTRFGMWGRLATCGRLAIGLSGHELFFDLRPRCPDVEQALACYWSLYICFGMWGRLATCGGLAIRLFEHRRFWGLQLRSRDVEQAFGIEPRGSAFDCHLPHQACLHQVPQIVISGCPGRARIHTIDGFEDFDGRGLPVLFHQEGHHGVALRSAPQPAAFQ